MTPASFLVPLEAVRNQDNVIPQSAFLRNQGSTTVRAGLLGALQNGNIALTISESA